MGNETNRDLCLRFVDIGGQLEFVDIYHQGYAIDTQLADPIPMNLGVFPEEIYRWCNECE